MKRLLVSLVLSSAACTDGPGVSARWDTTEHWGDGNCNQDFTWYDTIAVSVDSPDKHLASGEYRCDAGGFSLDVPDGATALTVEVTLTEHQDATHVEQPVDYTVDGPVHGRIDLGKLVLH